MPDNRSNAIVAGTFADFKIVKSRSVAQLVIELPLEKAQEAIEMFGVPMPGAEIWVAVARLVAAAHSPGSPRAPEPPKLVDPSKSERAKAEYAGKDKMAQAVTRAAMLSQDARFQSWVDGHGGKPDRKRGSEAAAEFIRHRCGVTSRSEIGADDRAYRAWLDLEHQFAIYQGRETAPR